MKTIATLGPSVRLVVFQFLMKSAQVPSIIPLKRPSITPPLPPVSGVEVLKSTPGLDISPIADHLVIFGSYQLVDVWKKPHDTNWNMSFVRFVFCHKKHVKSNELFPDFTAKKYQLEKIFFNIVTTNLWATQGYLNPYFDNGAPTEHKVLMIGCAGRLPNTEVYSCGRDENNHGVGPKVLMSTLASSLNMKAGEVVLVTPS